MRRVDLFPFRLTSHCIRFAVPMVPVWLRWSVCNRRRCSVFALDYPLVWNRFSCRYSEWSSMGVSPSAGPARPMRSWNLTGVRGCSLSDLGFRPETRSNDQIASLAYQADCLRSSSASARGKCCRYRSVIVVRSKAILGKQFTATVEYWQ